MGLFDKKYCDVCGERIRFLGNRKLEDGNLCKECEGKLSPWFSDRRRSTVQDIKDQLAYREKNKEKVSAFQASRTLGEGNLLLIDDEKKQFIIRRSGQGMGDNPDVLSLDQVQSCEIEIDHSKIEEKTKNDEGKMVSYDPPRHTHSYRFYLNVLVNHPFFDDMRFRVNKNNVEIKTGVPLKTSGLLANVKLYTAQEPDTTHCEDYQKYQALSEELRRALLQVPEEEEETENEGVMEAPAPQAIVGKVACPFCTAVSEPDANGCCPYCGEKVI
ncbi:MAG: DUF4428 domain-containing protein [Clostridia bacterium]|nr:DUF4428 domain-containing protein [Clostridia bacterium]